MSSKKVDDYAMTLWELAQHGSPVEVAVWERVIGISSEGPRGQARRASPENQRQTFKRFRDWCAERGLAVEKRPVEAGEPTLIEFDAPAARALAEKVRPRLSRRACRSTAVDDQQRPSTHLGGAQDEHLDPKSVARLLDVRPRTVRELVKRGELVAIRVGRKLRISRASLRAFIERSTVRSKS